MHGLRSFARRLLFPARHARSEEERRLEQMMGFHGQYRTHRDVQLRFLKARGLAPQQRLLEIGCGPLTLGIPIIEYLDAGRYTGIDVRPVVVDVAHRLISEHRLGSRNPRILHSSTFGEEELRGERFDVIVAFSVLFHAHDDAVAGLMRQLPARLHPGGVFFANVNTVHEPSQWLEFPFLKRPLDFYAQLAARSALEMEVLGLGSDLGLPASDAACSNHYLAFRPSS
jgi:SAM-dependent methyltransferase